MPWELEETRNRFHLLLLCICQLTASKVHAFGRMAALRNHPKASTAFTRVNVIILATAAGIKVVQTLKCIVSISIEYIQLSGTESAVLFSSFLFLDRGYSY